MRNRKTETAVFVSMGISKVSVFLQMFVEILCIWFVSNIFTVVLFGILAPVLSEGVSKWQGLGAGISVSAVNVCRVFLTGIFVLTVITLLVSFPVFTKKIKDTLSEMEG